MNSINKDKQRCQSLTMKNVQCKNICKGEWCSVHRPEECERRRLNRELLDREHAYIKYVFREIKKREKRYRKYLERQQHKKQCKAVTTKGLPCKITARSEYCHVHAYLAVEKPEPAPEDSVHEESSEEEEEQCYEIRALIKEIERERDNVTSRSYSGMPLESSRQRMVNQFYEKEKKDELELYKGMLNMLKYYNSLDEIDLDGVKKEIKTVLSVIRKNTDNNVKYMMKR